LLISDQIKKQHWYIILALMAISLVPASFVFGIMYLLLPNALATLWGQIILMRNRVVTKIDFINMYVIKIVALIMQSFLMMPWISNWPLFISGMLCALLSFSFIPFMAREHL
jgi:hypothetical protein